MFKKQTTWEEEFDENWATVERVATGAAIFEKNGQMVFSEKDKSQLTAIKDFIRTQLKKERQLVIEEMEELIKAEMIDFTCYQTMAGTQNLKDLAHNAALEELLSKLQTPKQS